MCWDDVVTVDLLCGKCDVAAQLYCKGGMICVQSAAGRQCARYCCTDADCGTGSCDKTSFDLGGTVGVCSKVPPLLPSMAVSKPLLKPADAEVDGRQTDAQAICTWSVEAGTVMDMISTVRPRADEVCPFGVVACS